MDIDLFPAELGAFIALQLEGKAPPTQDEPVAGPPSFPRTSHWLWDTACPAGCNSFWLAPCHLHRAGARSQAFPPYLRWRREGRGLMNAVSGPALETELTGAKLPLQISAVTHLAPLQGQPAEGQLTACRLQFSPRPCSSGNPSGQ